MTLITHKTVDAPATFASDSPAVSKSKLNSNFNVCENNEQDIEDRTEDSLEALFSSGTVSGMTAPVPSNSLGLVVADGAALIGVLITHTQDTVSCLASANPGYIYYCQDGTWVTNNTGVAPTTKSNYLFATYTSDGSKLLTVTRQNVLVLTYLQEIGDTINSIVVTDAYADYFVDHSALGSFSMTGFLTLNVDNTDAFYVTHINPGGLTMDSDTENTGAPDEDTPSGFWVRLTRKAGYYYAGNPTVSLTYTRRGFMTG
jgi:hypothetical protein